MKTFVAALLCACVAVGSGSPLLFGVQKAQLRIASLDPVEADTPADTKLLKETEKKVDIAVPASFLTYSFAQPAYSLLRKKRALVAKVRTVHGLAEVAAETPASTGLLRPMVSEHSVAMPQMVYLI